MPRDTLLKKSQRVKLADGRTVTVTDKFGSGGQGTVYKVRIDGTKEYRALKWYFVWKMTNPKGFYENLKNNARMGSPSPAFIWPEEVTEYNPDAFGYIMPIIPKTYKEMPQFLLAHVRFRDCSAMVNSALNISDALLMLHNKGYNYQDLNDGNVYIEPDTGSVLICDNDNVMGQGQWSGIAGKMRYMAPEVVRGDKKPDKQTDRFSLAVVLYLLLIGDHPLEGKRTFVPFFSERYQMKFFGIEPVFSFDKQNDSNRPHPEQQKNALSLWPCFPSYIQEAFCKSFSQDSLLRGRGRLQEQDWRYLLLQLKSSIVKCPRCGAEMFLESDRAMQCSDCGTSVKPDGYIKFLKIRFTYELRVPLFKGACVYRCHVDDNSTDCMSKAAEVLVGSGRYGLKNYMSNRWTVSSSDGRTGIKNPGDAAVLAAGFKIDFGNGNVAEIIAN